MQRVFSEIQRLLAKGQAVGNPLDTMPDFQNMDYQFAIEPSGSGIRAWSKLRECERRLEMYKWVESLNDPRIPQHRVLLNDSVSAFLLSFEATIQFLNDQFEQSATAPQLGTWMAGHPQYDVTIRGLRTLRHFEAHVEHKPPRGLVSLDIGSSLPDGTSDTKVSRKYMLPSLQQSDIARLHHAPLAEAHLNEWQSLVWQSDVASIFADGIRRLSAILTAAESLV